MSDRSTYERACHEAQRGLHAGASMRLHQLEFAAADPELRGLAANGRGVLAAIEGHLSQARWHLRRALSHHPDCSAALANIDTIDSVSTDRVSESERTRIGVLSLLFNWPSTGGGTVHTQELCAFLLRAGYDVRHFYAQYEALDLGCVLEPLPYPSQPIEFTESTWQAADIRFAFCEAVRRFDPHCVVVTDSWNSKLLLTEAVAEFPYFVRIAALECLCPLNNVRLLIESTGAFRQCDFNQLESPQVCRDCVPVYDRTTGELHRAERALAGFGSADYSDRLRAALRRAEGVFVVNPLIADMVRPHVPRTYVVPSGFDRARFPATISRAPRAGDRRQRILFAGFVDELMKGFHVLRAAGEYLWQRRRDFEIVATAEPPGAVTPFLTYVGWQSQRMLPEAIAAADILVFPTIAQEALGRSAVEAMGCGRPVVASRIGGLPWVVEDGVTGLLFTPGDPIDLALKLERLLDDRALAERMGQAGRAKFERNFVWEAVLERHYQPLFGAALIR